MSDEIFVVGASRSGTNLARALLNAHSALWVSAETHYFDDLRPRLPGSGTQPLQGEHRERCERYFLQLSHRAFGQGGEAESSRLDSDEMRALANELGGTGDAYFEALCRLRAAHHGRERWGEKTPRHVYRIDELLSAFPEAKTVVDPELQMNRNLAELKRTRGLAAGDDFLAQLTRAARAGPARSVAYANGRLETKR